MKYGLALILLSLTLRVAAEDPRGHCPLKGKWLFDPQRAATMATTEEERVRLSKLGPFVREYTCTEMRGYFPDDSPEDLAEVEWRPYQIKSRANGVLVLPVVPYDVEHRIRLAGECFWLSTNLNAQEQYYCRAP